MLIEAVVGYPDRLVRAIGHPVIWIGKLISALEFWLNREAHANADNAAVTPPPEPGEGSDDALRGRGIADGWTKPGDDEVGVGGSASAASFPSPLAGEGGGRRSGDASRVRGQAETSAGADPPLTRRLASARRHPLPRGERDLASDDLKKFSAHLPGIAALVILLIVVGIVAAVLQSLLGRWPLGFIALALIASSLIAQRSLHDHVARVATALETGGLEAGRTAVGQIVGRDPAALDEAGVARAAIESLAENFSDGVVAPVFWLAAGGLPGAALYKTVNTADSMIGHKTPRYQNFGWAAARLDDLLNLPASRLAAGLLIAAAALISRQAAAQAWAAVRRDARHHRSPNAGFPEAAMAGALALKLAGSRVYAGVRVDDAFMGDGRRAATAADIRAALSLYRRADALLVALLAVIAAALIALA